jgi:hypothetical protein
MQRWIDPCQFHFSLIPGTFLRVPLRSLRLCVIFNGFCFSVRTLTIPDSHLSWLLLDYRLLLRMSTRREPFHKLAIPLIPTPFSVTPAFSSAALSCSLLTKLFRLTRLFSVRSSHSCPTLFSLKPVSPAFATYEKYPGYTPVFYAESGIVSIGESFTE